MPCADLGVKTHSISRHLTLRDHVASTPFYLAQYPLWEFIRRRVGLGAAKTSVPRLFQRTMTGAQTPCTKESSIQETTKCRETAAEAEPDLTRREVWRMFDRISGRYDLLNRLLSMRRDVAWRRRLARLLPPGDRLRVLDLATGTGDVLIALARHSGRVGRGVGVDMAGEMLRLGRTKFARAGLTSTCGMVRGDALCVPVQDGVFDAVAIAFGIRNVADVNAGLEEMKRVLRPGGRALVLEFSLPGNALLRRSYLLYFRHVLPWLGGAVSGDHKAYRYLNQTVESFPYGSAFCELMQAAGFNNVRAFPMTFGIATIYAGDAPER